MIRIGLLFLFIIIISLRKKYRHKMFSYFINIYYQTSKKNKRVFENTAGFPTVIFQTYIFKRPRFDTMENEL